MPLEFPPLKKITPAHTQMLTGDFPFQRDEISHGKKYQVKALGFKSVLSALATNKQTIFAFSNKSKLDIAKNLLNDLGIKNLGFVKEEQTLNPESLKKFINKGQFEESEFFFLLKYFSHAEQGLGVLDLNSKSDYEIYTALKDQRATVNYPVILATHGGLFSLLEQQERYADYDVMNSEEARKEAEGNQYSLLHVTKAEIDLPEGTDEHSQAVYDKVVENFKAFQDKGWLVQDAEPRIYIYGQTMGERTQYGFVACTSIDDYFNESIKKHELTRREKEDDRMIHVNITDANVEPVFFAYPAQAELDGIIEQVIKNQKPEYDFVADDGFGHHFRVIEDQAMIAQIQDLFAKVPALYVADGHHRTAAAARVGLERRSAHPDYT